MFTGIVSGAYPIRNIITQNGLLSFSIDLPREFLRDIEVGASVAIDGVCLTVTRFTERSIDVDVMEQTLRMTTLAHVHEGDLVNVERSHRPGMEIGGHLVSGHIDGTAQVVHVDQPPHNVVLKIALPKEWMKYIFPKGFIALNGASLTVAEVDKKNCTITVYLIPETVRRTTFGQKKVGDSINFEVERQTQAIVDTIIDFLAELAEKKQLSLSELQNLQRVILASREKDIAKK